MSYSRNFGFRTTENIVRGSRFKTPATASGADQFGYLQGTGVVADPASAGFLKRPTAGDAPTVLSGLAIYEHIIFQGVDPVLATQYDAPFNLVPLGRYAQVVHGPGVKVWFQNGAAGTFYDGRVLAAVTMLGTTASSLAIGDGLTVGANGTFVKSTDSTHVDNWFKVSSVNTTTGLVEAIFTF